MDGDFAKLKEILNICEKYKANLIVDEAHATGVIGNKGEGLVKRLNLENKVFARVHTFGKAIGCHGSIILGSELLRNYLINFSRSFIYTTALPLHSLISIKCAYEKLASDNVSRSKVFELINIFKKIISENINLIESESGIQCVIIPGNENVKKLALHLQNNGFDIRPILSPTVPKGKERLRICFHSFNTKEEVEKLVETIMKIQI